MNIVLISPYEVDFQPLGLASPLAHLNNSGRQFATRVFDLSVQALDDDVALAADVVMISVPVFGAIEEAVNTARRLRSLGLGSPIVFYNQYVTLHPESYFVDDSCYVVMGEFAEVLTQIACALDSGEDILSVEFVWDGKGERAAKNFRPGEFLPPARSALPPLEFYTKTKKGEVVGNVETARGCAHKCNYCSVYAAYDKHVVRIPHDVVHDDIDQCIRAGAGHITFIDADWFSTGKHGLLLLREMNRRHPWLPFDITARVDDLSKREEVIAEMKELGCTEVTTALEFPKPSVLEMLSKNVTMQQTVRAIELLRKHEIAIRPTFINYSPFIGKEDLSLFEEFVKEQQLEEYLDPLQRETRLLLYKGSPLLEEAEVQGLQLMEHEFHYDWAHQDESVDAHFNSIVTPDADGKRKKCCIKG